MFKNVVFNNFVFNILFYFKNKLQGQFLNWAKRQLQYALIIEINMGTVLKLDRVG